MNNQDLKLQIHLVAGTGTWEPNISNVSVNQVLIELHSIFIETAIEHLEWFKHDIKEQHNDWPSGMDVFIDASKTRIREYKGSTFYITDVKKGSIVFTASIVALAYWTLEKTIGSSFEEAWKSSKLDQKLKKWFRDKMDLIHDQIENRIRRRLDRIHKNDIISGFGFEPSIPNEINIVVVAKNEYPMPTFDGENGLPG